MQVAKLRAQIGRGDYSIDPWAVAGAMLRRMQDYQVSLATDTLRESARSRRDRLRRR